MQLETVRFNALAMWLSVSLMTLWVKKVLWWLCSAIVFVISFGFLTQSIAFVKSKWAHVWDLAGWGKKIWVSLSFVLSFAVSHNLPSASETLHPPVVHLFCVCWGEPSELLCEECRGLISHWLLLDWFVINKPNELLRKELWHVNKVPKTGAFYLPINDFNISSFGSLI